jgi:hypothetical protein
LIADVRSLEAYRTSPLRALPRDTVYAGGWTIATVGVVAGYMVFQRAFAYLGVPGTPIFISEILLLAFVVLHPEASLQRFTGALMRPNVLGPFAWAVFASIAYGLILVARGVAEDYPLRVTFQEIVFNVYPLYVFLGLWVAQKEPRLLERFMLDVAWLNGIYGIAYIVVLNNVPITMPGTDIQLFRPPLGHVAILLALLAFPTRGWRTWVPMLLNLVVLLGVQSRASYAGFAAGLLAWAWMSKRLGRTAAIAALVGVLFVAAWVADFRLPLARGASELSARNVAAAVIAPFDEQAAAEYSTDARNFSGTVEWRTAWWRGIWSTTHADPVRTFIGAGYGFELTSAATLNSSEEDLRTPHNWFMYALGYGGWFGVLIFSLVLLTAGVLLWRSDRLTGAAFGVPFLVASTIIATFSNFYETPYAAIPVWITVGMAIAPAVSAAEGAPPTSSRERRV